MATIVLHNMYDKIAVFEQPYVANTPQDGALAGAPPWDEGAMMIEKQVGCLKAGRYVGDAARQPAESQCICCKYDSQTRLTSRVTCTNRMTAFRHCRNFDNLSGRLIATMEQ